MEKVEDITHDRWLMVRERRFTSSALMQIIMQLRHERITGTLLIDLTRGGINSIRLREEQDIHYDPQQNNT